MFCTVTFPHVREIDGQVMMLEPALSGVVELPDDEETTSNVERGWLKSAHHPYRPVSTRDESLACGDCYAPADHPIHRVAPAPTTPRGQPCKAAAQLTTSQPNP